MRTVSINAETTMLSSIVPVPGIGFLPINAFLIKGSQPVLVDCGITPEHDEFMDALRSLIDPAELRWIWVTHSDRDHTGALSTLLAEAPAARVVNHLITLGIMTTGQQPIPPDRAYLVRDGSVLDAGDRTLTAIRPPLFDNAGTVGLLDSKQGLLISSDCFGAALPTEQDAMTDDVASLAEADLTAAQLLWGSIDSPWAHVVDRARFGQSLAAFAAHDPSTVLSTHLPPIRGDLERHINTLGLLPDATPWDGQDRAALEATLTRIAHS